MYVFIYLFKFTLNIFVLYLLCIIIVQLDDKMTDLMTTELYIITPKHFFDI